MKNMRLFFISVIACLITSCAMQQGVRDSNYSDISQLESDFQKLTTEEIEYVLKESKEQSAEKNKALREYLNYISGRDIMAYVLEESKDLSAERNKALREYLNYISVRDFSDKEIMLIRYALNNGHSLKDCFDYFGLYIENPYCENDYKKFKIFQVLVSDYAALAYNCEKKYGDTCSAIGSSVFYITRSSDELYFDDKIISPNKEQCVVFTGTYSYETKNNIQKTVPKVEFAPKIINTRELYFIRQKRSLPSPDHNNIDSMKQWTEFYKQYSESIGKEGALYLDLYK